MTVRVVKVTRCIIEGQPWKIIQRDKDMNIIMDEELIPNLAHKEWQGARVEAYYKAEKSVDGWNFRARYRGRPLYW